MSVMTTYLYASLKKTVCHCAPSSPKHTFCQRGWGHTAEQVHLDYLVFLIVAMAKSKITKCYQFKEDKPHPDNNTVLDINLPAVEDGTEANRNPNDNSNCTKWFCTLTGIIIIYWRRNQHPFLTQILTCSSQSFEYYTIINIFICTHKLPCDRLVRPLVYDFSSIWNLLHTAFLCTHQSLIYFSMTVIGVLPFGQVSWDGFWP